jgi:GTP-binding protein
VGRPNVGKSTLFNRLLRSRRAITDPTPGVTRDPVEADWVLDGHPVKLIDTGGYKTEGNELDAKITAKSVAKAREADLILLVLDIMDMTPEDEEFVRLLRPLSNKVLVVLNKADGLERESFAADFYGLGFSEYICVSAEHNRRIGELEEAVAARLTFSGAEVEDVQPDIRLAILGKPNAGKSTLVNRLTGVDLSIVSPEPGTTRDPVEGRFEYKGAAFRVVDTAGIRRKTKVGENIEYYSVNRALKTIAESDVVVLLIDAVEGLSDQDKKIAAQIVKDGRGVILGLNKWDALESTKNKVKNQVEAYVDRIRFLFPVLDFAPAIPLSAQDGTGIAELLSAVVKVNKQLHQRIETARLNEMLKIWMEDVPTAQVKGVIYKIRYLTQVSTLPVKFLAFGNHGKNTPGSLTGYIINRIRKDLGFADVPIELEVRGGTQK